MGGDGAELWMNKSDEQAAKTEPRGLTDLLHASAPLLLLLAQLVEEEQPPGPALLSPSATGR